MLSAMVEKLGVIKENHLKSNSLVTIKTSATKPSSKLFGVSKRYIGNKMGK